MALNDKTHIPRTASSATRHYPLLRKWPRQESNLHLQNRNLKFYPLKYGAERAQKKVELQGIEPWSREVAQIAATCLANFIFRERQGYSQPQSFLSCCFLEAATQPRDFMSLLMTPLIRCRRTKQSGDDGFPRSYREISLSDSKSD